MRLTILGDVVTFALSAACDVPGALLCVRRQTSHSSALLYIFEHVSAAEAVDGSSNYIRAVARLPVSPERVPRASRRDRRRSYRDPDEIVVDLIEIPTNSSSVS